MNAMNNKSSIILRMAIIGKICEHNRQHYGNSLKEVYEHTGLTLSLYVTVCACSYMYSNHTLCVMVILFFGKDFLKFTIYSIT